MLNKTQVQRIYGMGAALGMLDNNNHKDDMLHNLVYNITGQDSVKQLTDSDYKKVVAELAQRIKISQLQPPEKPRSSNKRYNTTAKGMTAGQQRKVWALMYQLAGCDTTVTGATKGERLCGIIKKELHIDASPQKPFEWLGFEQGNKLIELLKNYVKSAERKAMRSM